MKHDHTHNALRTTAKLLCAAALALGGTAVMASPLVYTPVNPSFGGNAFNGSYLLSIATQGASAGAPNPLGSLDLTSLSDSLSKMGDQINSLCTKQGGC